MATLSELVRAHTVLDEDDVTWLQMLIADWQVIADLSFADLVLWLPDRDGGGFRAVAHVRPTTGPTAYVDDPVGQRSPPGRRPLIDSAFEHERVAREGDPEWRDDVPVRAEAIPVRRGPHILGVIGRNTNLLGVRTPSRLELAYLQSATDLTQMIAGGHFPFPGPRSDHADSPRVGDGFLRIDATGRVSYASPNALSVYRRLGLSTDLTGLELAETTRGLVPPARRPDEETLSAVLGGRSPRDTEIGADTVVILRAIPLRPTGEHLGALVLLRDVTDLRRRDRELVSKDATIREIHHRVKNNLQTVAALLRLQARRIDEPQGRAALEEAVRRVGSIALVHETLSQALDELVDFDDIADQLQRTVVELSATDRDAVVCRRDGSFGTLPAEVATPLAMVLTEILQNAVEHGFAHGPGTVTLTVRRSAEHLHVIVEDDGAGLPADFDLGASTRLGLSIVRTLVESELGGGLVLGATAGRGTRVAVDLPLAR